VPSTPAPAEAPSTPTSARVAVAVMATLAVLLLLYVVVTSLGRDQLAATLAASTGVSRSEAERAVLVSLWPYATMGLLLLAGAVFLPRGRRWAQWAGLAGSGALAALTLLSAFAAGASTPVSVLLLVLSLAAITSLAARPTTAWVARSRAGV
jgi:hypothetical protein